MAYERTSDALTLQLIQSIRSQNTSEVQRLLQAGVDPNKMDEHYQSPLYSALFNKCNKEIFQALFQAGADPDSIDNNGHSLISSFADRGNTWAVRLLLEAGANPDIVYEGIDSQVLPAVVSASVPERIDILKMLLAAGASPNAKGSQGETPLFWVARSMKITRARASEHREIVDILISNGADVEGAIQFASEHGESEIVEYLSSLEKSTISLETSDQSSAAASDSILTAAEDLDIRALQAGVARGQPTESRDEHGNTPLLLLASKLDPVNLVTYSVRQASQEAVNSHMETVTQCMEALASAGAALDAKNYSGRGIEELLGGSASKRCPVGKVAAIAS